MARGPAHNSLIDRNVSAQVSYLRLGVYDTANLGIDPIPIKYRVSIADTDTCHLKKHIYKQ